MNNGLDLIELRVSREEARMILTAISLRHYAEHALAHLDDLGEAERATLTHYRALGYKLRGQIDEQLGTAR